jgi:sRNA-binding protein
MAETTKQRFVRRDAVLKCWRQMYPAFREPLPLAIGIHAELIAAETEAKHIVAKALAYWTRRLAYLEALADPTRRRHDLNGQVVGEVTDKQRRAAKRRVKGRKAHAKPPAGRPGMSAERSKLEIKAFPALPIKPNGHRPILRLNNNKRRANRP